MVEKQRVRMKICWVVGLVKRGVIIKNKLGYSFFFLFFFFRLSLFFFVKI